MNNIQSIKLPARSHAYLFLKLSILVVFLTSLHAWFFWDLNIVIADFICFSVFFLFFLKKYSAFSFSGKNLLICFLFFSVKIYSVKDANINGFIGAIACGGLISCFICIKDEYKIDIIDFITKALAILLAISIVAWVFHLLGFQIPYFYADFNDKQYLYKNHYFFLYNLSMINLIVPRFSSVFLEPGHLGILVAPLLFVNRFDLKKKEVFVFLVAAILTFSLAAYVLILVSFLIMLFINTNKPLIYTLSFLLFLFLGNSFFSTYNNGNNVVNLFIIERLEYENGDIAGNNRVSEYTDRYFEYFIKSDDNLFGVGDKAQDIFKGGGNAGYKRYLIQHGICGVLVMFFFYSIITMKYFCSSSFMFLSIYTLSFLQRSYLLWEIFIILYIISLPLLFNSRERGFVS